MHGSRAVMFHPPQKNKQTNRKATIILLLSLTNDGNVT